METESFSVIIAMVIGTVVGLGYFAGLWITVQALPRAKRPVLTWALSALLRVAGATVVFVVLLRWGVTHALAGLAGFVIARFGSTAIWGPPREPKIPTAGRRGEGEQ
ncbi:MAG: ATP synthase subunit I [Armatimonadota bacterium]|jgi:F1F0 ATPase subunit 2